MYISASAIIPQIYTLASYKSHKEFYTFTNDSDAMVCIETVIDFLNNKQFE